MFLQPDITQPRIAAQASVFSVHPGVPVTSLGADAYEDHLTRIEVSSTCRAEVATGLYRLGVSRAHIFPEPDAVSATIMWEVTGELDRLADDVIESQVIVSIQTDIETV